MAQSVLSSVLSKAAIFLTAGIGLCAEQPLLEALKYATENIAPTDWKNRLNQAQIEPADHNIFDRLVGRFPTRKDISLPALLSVCEEVEKTLPENGDFQKACLSAIGEQLSEKSQAQQIVDWILEAYPKTAPLAASPLSDPPLLSEENVGAPLLSAHLTDSSSSSDPCLNIAYIPYMDWVYFVSLQSIFPFPLEPIDISQGFLLAQPHYTFAHVPFDNASCNQSAPGISLVGGREVAQNWTLCGLFDYGRSSNHWDPESGYTHDAVNRWSVAPSLTYQWEKAYIQTTILGMYNRSNAQNSQTDISLSHWGIGARADGAARFPFSGGKYNLAPYLRFDYFASFQEDIHSLNTTYVKNAQFFQVKGLLQFMAELHPTSSLCLIPKPFLGFAYADSVSRNGHQASCDTLPDYPRWRAIDIGAELSLFYSPGLIAKALVDISLCQCVQIYSGSVSIGWKW